MARQNRVRKLITLEIKKEIIFKRENGQSVTNLSAEYALAKSTICSILKNKEEIKNVRAAKGIARLSSLRCNITEKMEALLLVWIDEKRSAGERISEAKICEKAKQLFADLKSKSSSTSNCGKVKEFFGTKGWFAGFRKRTGLHGGPGYGETISVNIANENNIAKQCFEDYKKAIVNDHNFIAPEETLDYEENGEIFHNKMPRITCIAKENGILTEELLLAQDEQTTNVLDKRETNSLENDQDDEGQQENWNIPSDDLIEIFTCWNKLSKLMRDYHPDIIAVERGLNQFNETLMAHFWRIQQTKLHQSILDNIIEKLHEKPPTDGPSGGEHLSNMQMID